LILQSIRVKLGHLGVTCRWERLAPDVRDRMLRGFRVLTGGTH